MAEERIDVVVDDKVDGNVEKKIRGIAAASEKGYTSVQKLKSALADINVSSVTKLQQASANVTNALAREMNAQARLTAVRDRSTLADAKAATEKQRLATETAKTEAATMRAAAAAAQAEKAQLSLAAAQARTAASGGDLAARAERLKGALDPLYAAQARFNSELAEARTLLDAGAINMRTYVGAVEAATGRLNAAKTANGTFNQGLNATGAAAKGNGHHVANIAAQMNDLGVQFAMAANSSKPLQGIFMALIQQGSQLAYIASTMNNGWRGVIGTMAGMVAKFAPVIAVLGLAYMALSKFNTELTKDAGLKEYVNTLGLTAKEMKKLEDQQVTMTDTLKATWTELSNNLLASMGLTTEEISTFWEDLSGKIITFMKYAFIGIGALTVALIKTLAKVVANIGIMFYNAGIAAKNLFLMSIEFLVNKTIDGINKIGDGINNLSEAAGFGKVVGQMDKINLGVGNAKQGMIALFDVDPVGDFNKAAQNSANTLERIGKRAQDNARKRLKAQADALKEARGDGPKGRKGAVDKTAENRAHALDMTNKKLDDELSRMKMLKDERAIQQRFDQIEQELAQKKITLNDAEKASIMGKIKAIEEYKYVQSELDRIYEQVTAPLRTYNATLQATNELLAKNAITEAQANQERNKAAIALAKANDPLYDMKEALGQAEAASKLYGTALQQQNYYEGIRQQMLADGQILSATYVAGVNAEVDALMRRNAALQQQQQIQSTVAAIVDPMKQQQDMLANQALYYAEIDRLRQEDYLSEKQWQQAKYALDAKFSEMRLQSAQSFFGELAGLQSSSIKEVAAIGKAAAIAQATIDGYVAVQKALASAPPPWNYALAAAVAVKTGMQVASIASTNVGNFATGGQFMVDGRGGVDNNNINMNVSRGERVTIETPAQQRANDTAANTPQIAKPSVKIVNVIDPREAIAAMDSSEGESVIMNIIERKSAEIGRLVGAK